MVAVAMGIAAMPVLDRLRSLDALAKPGGEIARPWRGVEVADTKHLMWPRDAVAHNDDLRRRIDRAQAVRYRRNRGRVQQVGLGQEKTVGDRRLLHRFDVAIPGAAAVHRINGGDDAIDTKAPGQFGIDHQRM